MDKSDHDSKSQNNSTSSNSNSPMNHVDVSNRDFRSSLSNPASPPINSRSDERRRKVLQPANYTDVEPASLLTRTAPVTDAIPPNNKIIDIKVIKGREIKGLGQDVYPNCLSNMLHRGLALIINIENFDNSDLKQRKGSNNDVIRLNELLKQLGYAVIIKSDLTLMDMIDELAKFKKCEDHSQADSTVVAVMSHGNSGKHDEGTLIYTRDCRSISSEHILSCFNNNNCSLLKGKPKIFFFQVCRGDIIDIGQIKLDSPPLYQLGRTVTDGCAVPASPTGIERSFDDMLITYSTLPGYKSFREDSIGSWFVIALCETFMAQAHERHVVRLMQLVDKKLKQYTNSKNWVQTLDIVMRGFNSKFYFNPGHWKIP